MTPWNLTLGQWSKNLTIATDILDSAPRSMVKMVILWLNFIATLNQRFAIFTMGKSCYGDHGRNRYFFAVKFCDKIIS